MRGLTGGIGKLRKERRVRKEKTKCHFDRREKSFLGLPNLQAASWYKGHKKFSPPRWRGRIKEGESNERKERKVGE